MRKEKKNAWGPDVSHEYTNENSRLVVEVGESGIAYIRDLEGRLIHVNHLLDLVDVAKVVDHRDQYPEVTA